MKSHTRLSAVNLQLLIDRLISFYQPVANRHNSFFSTLTLQNSLYLKTDAEALGTLMSSLFYIVARCSSDSSILISAACFHDRGAISLQFGGKVDSYLILCGFQHLELLAEELNGCLEITRNGTRETIVTFNFSNNPAVKKYCTFENDNPRSLHHRSSLYYNV